MLAGAATGMPATGTVPAVAATTGAAGWAGDGMLAVEAAGALAEAAADGWSDGAAGVVTGSNTGADVDAVDTTDSLPA